MARARPENNIAAVSARSGDGSLRLRLSSFDSIVMRARESSPTGSQRQAFRIRARRPAAPDQRSAGTGAGSRPSFVFEVEASESPMMIFELAHRRFRSSPRTPDEAFARANNPEEDTHRLRGPTSGVVKEEVSVNQPMRVGLIVAWTR